MVNLITGIKYWTPLNLDSPAKVYELINDLEATYRKLSERFRIKDYTGRTIDDFSSFFQAATGENPQLLLNGSGEIGGLVINEGYVEYDLSLVKHLTKGWNVSLETIEAKIIQPQP